MAVGAEHPSARIWRPKSLLAPYSEGQGDEEGRFPAGDREGGVGAI